MAPDSGDVALRIPITGAKVKRVQIEGKKVKFLLIADADQSDAVFSDLVRVSDGITKVDLTVTVANETEQNTWKLPGQ